MTNRKLGVSRRKRARSSARRAGKTAPKRWSKAVTQRSHALDLEPGVFKKARARDIAASLRRSALRSRRRKADPYRSALSMLDFYINRAGSNLSPSRRHTLERAKRELRRLFDTREST